jgi:2'-hydroxyisoflavone reductase
MRTARRPLDRAERPLAGFRVVVRCCARHIFRVTSTRDDVQQFVVSTPRLQLRPKVFRIKLSAYSFFPMNRRDLLKFGALAGASTLLSRAGAQSASAVTPKPTPQNVSAATGVARASTPLKILILGGTGFTGPQQVRYALARGHKLTLFNRGRRPKEWPGEVEELTGDRETGDLRALEGRTWDVCIDNPTSVPSWVRDIGRVLQGRVKQYVFISTLSAYAHTDQPGMTEDAPLTRYTGPDVMQETRATLLANMALYGPMKAACETEAEKQFPGITTIVRPTLIVGPGDDTDRFTYWPVRVTRGGEVLAPPAADPVQYIDARDLAEWTIRLAEQRAFGAFNGVGPGYELSVAALLHGIHAVVGGDAKFTHVPAEFLAAQKVSPWGDLPAWVPGRGETAGFSRVSAAKSIAAGLTYRPLATTVMDLLAWFRALPPERQAKLRAGLTPEREAAALKAWRERNG